jgi:hypothetical protein
MSTRSRLHPPKSGSKRLETWLRPYFPDFVGFDVKANVSRHADESTADSERSIREELGQSVYDELLAANQGDLDLFHTARRKFGSGAVEGSDLQGAG